MRKTLEAYNLGGSHKGKSKGPGSIATLGTFSVDTFEGMASITTKDKDGPAVDEKRARQVASKPLETQTSPTVTRVLRRISATFDGCAQAFGVHGADACGVRGGHHACGRAGVP